MPSKVTRSERRYQDYARKERNGESRDHHQSLLPRQVIRVSAMREPVLFSPEDSPNGGIASDDLNATVLSWASGKGVAAHVNDQVDVVMFCLSGEGEVTVDGRVFELEPGVALLTPKGCSREVRSLSDDFRYVNVHKRRPHLRPGGTRPGRP